MQFKRHLADKIIAGRKTQTRRSTERKRGVRVYEVCDRVGVQVGYGPPLAYVIIKNRHKQTLGEISEDDAEKEGFENVEEFRQSWMKLRGGWDPNGEIWVYDFVLEKQDSSAKITVVANANLMCKKPVYY